MRRTLRALQIEVTSRCTRRCAVCPRGALSGRWRDGDLSEEAWAAIEPGLPFAAHVHLQGWGEPLLHPRLASMAAAAKTAGCAVGITTNGDLLSGAVDWIVEVGVDTVTVSVGGTGQNGINRGGGTFAAALAAAGAVTERARGRAPRVQLSYMLTRDNAAELEDAVRDAAQAGIREVFAVHLDFTPVAELSAMSAFADGALLPGVARAQVAAARTARALGVRFRPARTEPADLLVCALDPTIIAYVAWDGTVGPCAYLLPPLAAGAVGGGFEAVGGLPAAAYGSVLDQPLDVILLGDARRRFVVPFLARLAAEAEFAAAVACPGFGTTALARVEEADRRRSEALAASPFPSACAGCHKQRGW